MESQYSLAPTLLEAYGLKPSLKAIHFTGGHINTTYLVKQDGRGYILQRINRYVFPRPTDIMENMEHVTAFLRRKVEASGGNPDKEVMQIIKTTNGQNHFIDEDGAFWRCLLYIDNTVCYENVTDINQFEAVGAAFGNFQNLLNDYPSDQLHIIIPDFHNTEARFAQLLQAETENRSGRKDSIAPDLAFAHAREQDCAQLNRLLHENKLRQRVTHNDTKLSNILFDKDTNHPVCIIDLDTIMPGLTAYDFGDSIRSGATTAAEDEPVLEKVNFDINFFSAYAKGFLSSFSASISETEAASLAEGARMITFETGLRFLADYLNGDIYFNTSYPEHNLVRARNQFKLVSDMEAMMPQMIDTVLAYYKQYAQA